MKAIFCLYAVYLSFQEADSLSENKVIYIFFVNVITLSTVKIMPSNFKIIIETNWKSCEERDHGLIYGIIPKCAYQNLAKPQSLQ
jgi:hypothetical protein